MARGLNKVMLIGHLGQDPDMRYTPTGRPITTIRIATNRSWKSADGERRTETEWFTVVAWGNLAELCNQYLAKGRQVYFEGRLHNRHWEDAEGNKRLTTEIVADQMIMLGERGVDKETPAADAPANQEDDEFPF